MVFRISLFLTLGMGFGWVAQADLILINVPGATSTTATGINNAGQIVGYYTDASGLFHGFVDNGGVFTTIDAPGASGTLGTIAQGINNSGQIVGYTGNTGSFLDNGGVFSSIAGPGPAITYAEGINDKGDSVGSYNGALSAIKGFWTAAVFSLPLMSPALILRTLQASTTTDKLLAPITTLFSVYRRPVTMQVRIRGSYTVTECFPQ